MCHEVAEGETVCHEAAEGETVRHKADGGRLNGGRLCTIRLND